MKWFKFGKKNQNCCGVTIEEVKEEKSSCCNVKIEEIKEDDTLKSDTGCCSGKKTE